MAISGGRAIEVTVQQATSGKRLDAFLASYTRTDGLSRNETRSGIEEGAVFLNGKIEKNPKKRLRYGDVVVSNIPLPIRSELLPNPDLSFPILFEDDDLLVISKPAGVQMHPAGNDITETVANWIAATRPYMVSAGVDPFRPGIVHRLDRNTSGVVVLAKTKEAFDVLQQLFRSRKVKKTYLALVAGHVTDPEGKIDYPLAHRTGTLRRRAIMESESAVGRAKESLTEYRLKERFRQYDLLEVFPKTGRTHQIRVHLAAIGHPVAGDRLYGGRRMHKDSVPKRQFLHAEKLAFPFFGKLHVFEAPLPADLADFLVGIDGEEKPGYPREASNQHDGA